MKKNYKLDKISKDSNLYKDWILARTSKDLLSSPKYTKSV
jgi:hypothetical protein